MTKPGRMRVFLAASLALNVFLLAFVGAQRVRMTMAGRLIPAIIQQGPVGRIAEAIFERASVGLSARDAAIMHQAVVAHQQEMQAAQRNFAQSVATVQLLLAQEPLDPAKLKDGLDIARAARQQIWPPVEAIMMEAFLKMSPQGRQTLSRYRLAR